MKSDAWLPTDERMAASGLAVFVEWLRAGGRMPGAEPASVLAWARARGAGFDAAMTAFMGWEESGPRIAEARGGREAVVMYDEGSWRSWSYDALPDWVPALLGAGDPVGMMVMWLLDANVCPDERILWAGSAEDPHALGGLYLGATVIIAPGAPAVAVGARVLHA